MLAVTKPAAAAWRPASATDNGAGARCSLAPCPRKRPAALRSRGSSTRAASSTRCSRTTRPSAPGRRPRRPARSRATPPRRCCCTTTPGGASPCCPPATAWISTRRAACSAAAGTCGSPPRRRWRRASPRSTWGRCRRSDRSCRCPRPSTCACSTATTSCSRPATTATACAWTRATSSAWPSRASATCVSTRARRGARTSRTCHASDGAAKPGRVERVRPGKLQGMSETTTAGPLAAEELVRLDAYWRAANYLSVGQIYLLDNPLLREPLRLEHVKPRLLGHWGTTPGLNFVYAHMNRAIKQHDLDAIYVTGPGHGGPGLVANTYLEGTYTEVYPAVTRDAAGLKILFRQFSFPGGIPSHVAPETPGSIHEGGELGYALSHAYGAAFDNPDLLVACVVGDGEAETGALATSCHSNKSLNPVRDGAVLPILHLNGYKIPNPCFLARIPRVELQKLFEGYGYEPLFVSIGPDDEHADAHRRFAGTLDEALG